MNIEKSLISLVDLSTRRFDSTSNSSSGNFEDTLSMMSDRDVNSARNERVTVRDNVMNPRENNRSRDTGREDRIDPRERVGSSRDDRNRTSSIAEGITSSIVNETSDVANEEIGHAVNISSEELEIEYNPMLHITIIPVVAEILSMPEDDVKSILEKLNMNSQDLQDKSNLSEFIQVAYDVESSAELLDIPDILQTLATISDSIEDVVESMPKMEDNITRSTESINEFKIDGNVGTNTSTNTTSTGQDNMNLQQSEYVDEENVFNGKNTEELLPSKPMETSQNVFSGLNANKPSSILADVSSEGKVHFNVDKANVNIKSAPIKSQSVQLPIAQDVVNQITERIKFDVKGAVSEVRMLLKPENLGEISLKILTENGVVTAQFLADSQKIKEIIEANLNELKEALSEQGIDVSELSVSVGQDEAGSQMQNFLKEQEKSQQRISQIIKNIMDDPEENDQNSIDMTNIYNNNVNYTA